MFSDQNYLLIALLLLCGFGCEPIADMDYSGESQAPLFRATTLTDAPPMAANPEVRVMAWNIKYGAGRIPFWFDCWGDRSQLTEAELAQNMAGIYDLINEAKPDIFMAEEIELHSRRSQYFNMIQGILDATDLNYAA
jgi:hypothetical protein